MSFSFGSHHPKKTYYQSNVHHTHQQKPKFSRVRAVHNVAKGPNVKVALDGKVVLSNVPYKAISDYLQVPSGKHNVAITTLDEMVLANINVNLVPGADYTVIAHGDIDNPKSISLLPLMDDNSCPKMGFSHVRFVHAAAKVPVVDIWAGNGKVFKTVSYGNTGYPVYLPVQSGEISLAVTPAGSSYVVLGPIPLKLEQRKTYTVIASGLLNDKEAPLSALVSEDNACSTIHMF